MAPRWPSRISSIRSCDVSSHGAGENSTPSTTGWTLVVTRPISSPAKVSQYTNCSVHGSGRLTATISSSTPHWRISSAVRTLIDRARGWGFTPLRRSTTMASRPMRPSRIAIDSPAGPAPAMRTAASVMSARRLAHSAPYRRRDRPGRADWSPLAYGPMPGADCQAQRPYRERGGPLAAECWLPVSCAAWLWLRSSSAQWRRSDGEAHGRRPSGVGTSSGRGVQRLG